MFHFGERFVTGHCLGLDLFPASMDLAASVLDRDRKVVADSYNTEFLHFQARRKKMQTQKVAGGVLIWPGPKTPCRVRPQLGIASVWVLISIVVLMISYFEFSSFGVVIPTEKKLSAPSELVFITDKPVKVQEMVTGRSHHFFAILASVIVSNFSSSWPGRSAFQREHPDEAPRRLIIWKRREWLIGTDSPGFIPTNYGSRSITDVCDSVANPQFIGVAVHNQAKVSDYELRSVRGNKFLASKANLLLNKFSLAPRDVTQHACKDHYEYCCNRGNCAIVGIEKTK